MHQALPVVIGCAALAVACGGTPTRPTGIAHLSRTHFMAFGDSLTAGEVTAPIGIAPGPIGKLVVVPSASYPAQLRLQLATRYVSQAPAITVSNAGLGGENLFRAVQRFEEALTDQRPEAVLIMHGVNNIGPDPPEILAMLMRDMTRTAKGRNVRVFIGSMLPTIAGRLRSRETSLLEGYNAALRQMSIEEGVVFVDLYTTLLPEALTVIGVDGLHPTEAGYRRIAEVFFTAIAATLEE